MTCPKLIREEDGLKIYEIETLKDRNGKLIRMRMVEELIEGRWEAFMTTVGKNETE